MKVRGTIKNIKSSIDNVEIQINFKDIVEGEKGKKIVVNLKKGGANKDFSDMKDKWFIFKDNKSFFIPFFTNKTLLMFTIDNNNKITSWETTND